MEVDGSDDDFPFQLGDFWVKHVRFQGMYVWWSGSGLQMSGHLRFEKCGNFPANWSTVP